jgi:molybdopterin molybdotransferase
VLAHAAAEPITPTLVRLQAAAGLTLAENLRTRAPLPAFDTAAMDGYAICDAGPHRLRGEIRAGSSWNETLEPGEGVQISTGAPVPAGTTAILRLEDAVRHGDIVSGPDVSPGKHVRRAGEDAPAGFELAPAGSAVGPAMLGLAAACGHDRLLVTPRPRVQVLVTGDELAHSGLSAAGRVRDALGPMLPALITEMGGEVNEVCHVPDHPADRLATALHRTAANHASVIIVTGSTSVGATDRLRPYLHRYDTRWVVDSVACRPGHPQLLVGFGPGRWLIGLPGNPFAALVAAYTLLAPLLAGLAGRPLTKLPTGQIAGDVHRPAAGLTRLMPVVYDGGVVRVLGGDRPAFLGGAARADALAAVSSGWEPEQYIPLVPTR